MILHHEAQRRDRVLSLMGLSDQKIRATRRDRPLLFCQLGDWKVNRESRAVPCLAFHIHLAVMGFDQLFDDGKP